MRTLILGGIVASFVGAFAPSAFAEAECKLEVGDEVLTGQACEAKLAKHCKSRGVQIKGSTVRGAECLKYYRGFMATDEQCKAHKKNIVDKLGSSSLPDYHRDREGWLKKAIVFGTVATDENLAKLKVCQDYDHMQKSTTRWLEDKRKSLRETWGEAIAQMATDSLSYKSLLKSAQSRNNPISVMQTVDSELDTIAALKKHNALPLFQADVSGLDKRLTALNATRGQALAALQKKMSGTKCSGNKNKKLSKKLFKVVKTHFDSGTHPKDVKQFVVTGRASKKRLAYEKITHEDIPGLMCYESKIEKKKEYEKCGRFSISVRRTKIDGQKWGPYKDVLVGSLDYMNCKGLR